MVCLLICWSWVMWSWSRVVFLSTSIPCINSRHTVMWFYFFLDKLLTYPLLVVHWSSETSTNLLDVIIRSDDRFLYLVVDSDSIVSKIYRLNFVLWLLLYCWFFLSPYRQKYCSFIPAGFFLPSYWQYLAVLSKRTFDTQSIHIFGLVYHLSTSRNSPFYIRSYTIFCFVLKLMFTNGKILVCKYIIWFYSNLYFCQTLIWTSLLFIYLYQVLHIWKTIFCFVLS